MLVTMILCRAVRALHAGRLCLRAPSRSAAATSLFVLVLLQLMIMPDVLIVENYRTMTRHRPGRHHARRSRCPIWPRPSASSCCARPSRRVPQELDDAARLEGAGPAAGLAAVYVPLAKPTYIAYGLVSVSYHWNNFLWPLVITNSVGTRPLTVGLQVFAAADQGIDWSIITRGDADDLGAAAGRVPAVPAPIRAELHARRHPLSGTGTAARAPGSAVRPTNGAIGRAPALQ